MCAANTPVVDNPRQHWATDYLVAEVRQQAAVFTTGSTPWFSLHAAADRLEAMYHGPEREAQRIASVELDAATVEIGRLNEKHREVARLCKLSPSELLVEWRQFCLKQKRFSPPDWETGEAGMLRELVRHTQSAP